ncbi:MAG: hypothetical protein FWE97_00995 [Dehalococcoidia bacterium]|nr:hypothetical protein [Dehalococcoidia bacterium]
MKRILTILLAAVMLMAVAAPVVATMAAEDIDITATYNKSAKVVTVTVDGVTGTQGNVNNNSTVVIVVNGWEVTVDAKGDVATIKSKKQVAPPVVSDPAKAFGNGNQKIENQYDNLIKQDFNNAQFHCNAISGNGRVWPVIPVDMKKFDGKLLFAKADGTKWNLVGVEDKKGVQLDMVVCPHCGSTEWITFSNNSGVPDGKNIQMQHPGANFTIVKEWAKNNAPYAIGVKFFANFKITLSTGKTFVAGPGKYFLPSDLEAVVEEIACTNGFSLDKVLLNGEEVTIGAIEGIVGGDVAKFVNRDEPQGGMLGTIWAEKWVGGQNIVGWAVDTYGEDAIEVIAELFEGMRFQLYAAAGDGADIIGAPILFNGVDYVMIDFSGVIAFTNVEPGWYAIVENFVDGSLAQEIFKSIAPLYVYVGQSWADNRLGSGDAGGYELFVTDFDYDAPYTVVNGHGGGYVLGYPGLNNTGDIFYIGVTNTNTGTVYDSFCANAGSRAFAGESGMGCSGYLVAENFRNDAELAAFVSAYNYIADTYGNLNDYRAITQIITWYLLGNIDNLDLINWAAVETGTAAVKGIEGARGIVEDVIANYDGYKGNGTVIDVVYMVCEDGHDYYDCQPQLVPVYGETIIFENQLA